MAGCKQADPENRSGIYPAIGERLKMASFETVSITDKKIHSSKEYEGKVLLVTFFATWCPPCIQEIPSLIDLQQKYASGDFSVIAFSMDEGDLDPLVNLINKYKINYPIFFAEPAVTKSFGGVTGIPVTFVVNRRGEIVKKYLGYVDHDTLEEAVGDMLKAG
jgi:thiol-disulfide isomerase/thioredoxin